MNETQETVKKKKNDRSLSTIYQRIAAVRVIADHAELEQISRNLRVHQVLEGLSQHQRDVRLVCLLVGEETGVFVLRQLTND